MRKEQRLAKKSLMQLGAGAGPLEHALSLLEVRIAECIGACFGEGQVGECPPFFPEQQPSAPLGDFLREKSLSTVAQNLLVLALAPHVFADFLDNAIQQALREAGDFPQIGGVRGRNFRGLLPTGETALFLLGGSSAKQRSVVQQLLSEEHRFTKERVLWLEEVAEGEPRMSGRIILSQEYVDLFTVGRVARPRLSAQFPAEHIETELEWSDLVLNQRTLQQVKEIEVWSKHRDTLMERWGMRAKLKPGYRALFHGPPGTGKTLTASLLGKYTGKDVYRIDLSVVVSKYVGETEKNLSNLFARAENKDWVLFFDEAEGLFHQRTGVNSAHDKYANQEVSYLLQRVERYDGLVILATNLRSHVDDAFIRRFQSIIHFPMPDARERLQLWKKAFPAKAQLSEEVHLSSIASRHELTGADIMNVVQYACLRALDRGDGIVFPTDISDGIEREFEKEGRIAR